MVWDVNTGKTIATFVGHTEAVTSVAFSSDSKYVLTGSADMTARVWDLRQPAKALKIFNGSESPVWAVAFSPNGKEVITGSRDDLARLRNLMKQC
jgi:WD40 repeat protein